MNLTELLNHAASRWPQKSAFIEGDKAISYSELAEQAADIATKLADLKLPEGCRIGLRFPNSIAYVALTFALWRLRAVVVPIPTECAEEEVSTIAEAMQLEGILTPRSPGQGAPIASECCFTRLRKGPPPDHLGLDLAFIRFTSGTTSARKGVALCHETVMARVNAANRAFRVNAEDTVIWCLPMSHHFLITIVLYLSRGATVVLTKMLVARAYLETVNRHRGTVLYAAPFHYGLLARDTSGQGLDSVRLAVSTTCALTRDVALAFAGRFGRPLSQALGIIEVGLVSLNVVDTADRWDSVGRPLEDFRVRILSPDESGCGEVAVRGPGMFDAYVAPWVPREQALEDGWFRTGDIGRLDGDGRLFLAGRKTSVINLAGRKVFPEEIEAVLNRHPAVRDSRVYGRAHPHLGEVVEAEVVLGEPQPTPAALLGYCRANLASYEIPAQFHVVGAVRRTADTGKIIRKPVAA